ncbi:MAG: TetR/AcrR family transcriptional regulator [Treponema sp.]|nr:TetR/AcrR family transcriptional regulator [Treponema sp.]
MIERTKFLLADTMKKLMQEKDVGKIHVSDICKAASIERATFYYHFRDKYQLIMWAFIQDVEKTDLLNEDEAAAGLERMKQNFMFFKKAYECSLENPIWNYILEYFVSRYNNTALKRLGTKSLPASIAYSIRLYCHGAVGMTREWLLSDGIMNPHDTVKSMYRSMPTDLRILYFGK